MIPYFHGTNYLHRVWLQSLYNSSTNVPVSFFNRRVFFFVFAHSAKFLTVGTTPKTNPQSFPHPPQSHLSHQPPAPRALEGIPGGKHVPVVVVGLSFIGSCAQELRDPGGENTAQGFSSFLQPWSTWWEMKSQGNGDVPGATATPGPSWEVVMLPLLCCSPLPARPAQSQVGASIPALQGPFPRRWDCGGGDDVRGAGSTSLLDG